MSNLDKLAEMLDNAESNEEAFAVLEAVPELIAVAQAAEFMAVTYCADHAFPGLDWCHKCGNAVAAVERYERASVALEAKLEEVLDAR